MAADFARGAEAVVARRGGHFAVAVVVGVGVVAGAAASGAAAAVVVLCCCAKGGVGLGEGQFERTWQLA